MTGETETKESNRVNTIQPITQCTHIILESLLMVLRENFSAMEHEKKIAEMLHQCSVSISFDLQTDSRKVGTL